MLTVECGVLACCTVPGSQPGHLDAVLLRAGPESHDDDSPHHLVLTSVAGQHSLHCLGWAETLQSVERRAEHREDSQTNKLYNLKISPALREGPVAYTKLCIIRNMLYEGWRRYLSI